MTETRIDGGFRPTGQLQFGVFFQGVNSGTVWKAPEAGSQTDFESFRRIAQTAERGLFAAFFLGEGLRLREHLGRPHALDVAGRPDAQTMLAALASVTSHIGLVATQNTTYNDPADLAHRLSTLDHLSGGRAAWNVVTTDNAWTGANFRRGGYLDHAERYVHAEAFVETAKRIWDSWEDNWAGGAKSSPEDSWVAPDAIRRIRHQGSHYSVDYLPRLPRTAQYRPVLFQAGDSPEGRDFAARQADVIFSAHPKFDDALDFRRDIVERSLKAGRGANDVQIMPASEFILAATPQEARDKKAWVRSLQIGPQQAIAYLEQFWGRELSEFDPDGPLPEIDPVVEETSETRGSGFHGAKARQLADQWRAEAKEKGLSIRQFVTAKTSRVDATFNGSYTEVADRLADYARTGAVDGFNISPWLIPTGLDDIVNHLVPELQERGIYPTEYAGTTLRANLGLATPARTSPDSFAGA
ncbi:NtaA/DmoA family FMN-dependent monooxygenase [Pseudarthrobacter sp. J75]|uniref:NtaA/DmoA family FMN-dependent monooxygenase n=1 Tax=unclassified Pseudarthrobacter TaxID=2647000 RepID=UPI002E812D24|nr:MULTISPECIES: NtaA/DmoA family FMN-dependent monooxygenase [unclassified Pseudarthrobacter]MEE2524260.1 NtaA/DmoA family FMN-dependent monooxygenase [Pseudarthrobacter sp. J47]MEE2530144.1 NtaA/DmoA family FMN-dependent monooxygenase [Pseudarthrobacter sp. J75]